MDVKWQRGQFIKFFAKMKIRVGGAHSVDIQKGDEFEYDGSILKYAGAEIPSPQTRGAIKEGWADQNDDGGDGDVRSTVPSRQIAKSQSVNRDLNRVARGPASQLQTDSLDEETVLNVSDRRGKERGDKPKVVMAGDNRRAGMRVEASSGDQEGVTIGRVRTSTHFKGNVYEHQSLKSDLENLSGSGFIPDEDKVVHREGISIKTNIRNVDRNARVGQDEDEGVVVAKVRHSTRSNAEGVTVRDTSNIRAERASAKAAPAKKPSPAKKPAAKAAKPAPAKAAVIDTKLNPKIRMAKRIDPSFPNDWSFEGKLAERLERVNAHGATQTFLEALYAAEGDQMRKLLEKTFPSQFAG